MRWRNILSRFRKKRRVTIDELELEKAITTVSKSGFCTCESCRVKTIGMFEYAALRTGGHTTFVLHECLKCGKMGGFPQSNLELALEKGTIETLNALRKAGINVQTYLKTIEKERMKKFNPSKREQKEWD